MSGHVSRPEISDSHTRTVLMFPGQSSADPGMIARARTLGPAAEEVLDRAARVLDPSTLARYTGDTGVRLESNRDVQLSVFLTTQMHWAALRAAGVDADLSLGLSLGEYSHLVHIGALSFESALALVERRGAAYDQSPPGVMVAVLGATEEEVADAVARSRDHGVVVISNFNAPTQHVIAGDRRAVAAAAAYLEDEYGASTVETESRVPMHSPLLAPVAAAFTSELQRAAWQPVDRPYVPNVSAMPDPAPTASTFVERLTAHVTEPVRWRASVERVALEARSSCFVEVGPGAVLFNMLSRRWLDVRRAKTDNRDVASLAPLLVDVVECVRGGT
ncbi:MAG: ACP S-malonyltransferase [Vicinamibacterales bacterium]